MEEVPRRTSLVPLAFPCFVLCLIGVNTEGLLDYQGRAGDHFHCTVEPSSGPIRYFEFFGVFGLCGTLFAPHNSNSLAVPDLSVLLS